jgi:hypothetical protein
MNIKRTFFSLHWVKLLALALALILSTWTLHSLETKQDSTTTVLSWWGYLNDATKIQQINLTCNTDIQVTEYFNVDELKLMAQEKPFDLYIYPWGYHMNIEQYFSDEGPRINEFVEGYHNSIKQHYLKSKMPTDTVFFQHAVRMFVYNKKYVEGIDQLIPEDILELSNQGRVYLMDEIKQLDWLIKQFKKGTPQDNWVMLYRQIRARQSWHQANNIGLRFSNFAPSYLDEGLILGFLDSGEILNPNIDWNAISKGNIQKHLDFGIHPSLSQITSDVLAIKSYNSSDLCVAREMASRRFLKWVSEENYYFSPFEEGVDNIPEQFKHLAHEFYEQAHELAWIDDDLFTDPPSPQAERIWGIIKACQKKVNCKHWVNFDN